MKQPVAKRAKTSQSEEEDGSDSSDSDGSDGSDSDGSESSKSDGSESSDSDGSEKSDSDGSEGSDSETDNEGLCLLKPKYICGCQGLAVSRSLPSARVCGNTYRHFVVITRTTCSGRQEVWSVNQ